MFEAAELARIDNCFSKVGCETKTGSEVATCERSGIQEKVD